MPASIYVNHPQLQRDAYELSFRDLDLESCAPNDNSQKLMEFEFICELSPGQHNSSFGLDLAKVSQQTHRFRFAWARQVRRFEMSSRQESTREVGGLYGDEYNFAFTRQS